MLQLRQTRDQQRNSLQTRLGSKADHGYNKYWVSPQKNVIFQQTTLKKFGLNLHAENKTMRLFYFLLIGLAAGWLTGKIMKTSYGLLGNLAIGVVGAFVGGLMFELLGLGPTNLIGQLISAVVGAVVFVYLLRYLKSR